MNITEIVRKLLARMNGRRDDSRPTSKDIYYCYRLLLNREPSPDDFKYWKLLVQTRGFDIEFLRDSFLYSEEFRMLQEQRHTPQLVSLPDFKIYIMPGDYNIGAAIARDGDYETHVAEQLNQLLEPSMTFLDVGANIGYFSLMAAARVGPNGKVIAFEPLPQNCGLLRRSIEENGFSNVELFPNAVADKVGEVALTNQFGSSNSRLIYTSDSNSVQEIVQAVCLDDVLAGIDRLDIVKMDIEGAEPLALQGMQQLIHKFHPVIITEFSPDLIRMTSQVSAESLAEQLQSLDYELYEIVKNASTERGPRLSTEQIMRRCKDLVSMDHIDMIAYPKT